jgi:hypothetical protein
MMRTALTALLFVCVALPVGAQEKKTAKPTMEQKFKAGNPKEDSRHGQPVEITTDDGKKVTGTVVRADATRVFVRTQTGAAPQVVAKKDIKNYQKLVEYKLSKDGLALLATESDVIQPEIQGVVIVNGGRRTLTYSAPNLSPGELSLLQNIQSAEDDLYRLERMADRENQVMENVLAIQDEQRKSIELVNRYQDLLNIMVKQRADNPFWWHDQYYFAYYGVPPYQMYAPTLAQPYPIIQQQGPIVMPDVKVSHESLAKARQNLASLQAQTVYERSRLVAVVVKD